MKISVIVLCYLNVPALYITIDSVLEQDYPDIQLIISNDCSDDFEVADVESYIKSRRRSIDFIVCRNEQNLGIVAHLNAVLPLVKGEYIKNISPGDTFSAIVSLSDMVKSIGDGDVLVTPVLAHGTRVKYLIPSLKTIEKLRSNLVETIYVRNEINIIGSLYRANLVTSASFDTNYYLIEDYPLWIRLASQNAKFVFSETVYCKYQLGGMSTSGGNPQFNTDIIRLYEREILPQLPNFSRNIRREAMFEYRKHLLRHSGKSKIFFAVKHLDIVLKRKLEYYRNIKEWTRYANQVD